MGYDRERIQGGLDVNKKIRYIAETAVMLALLVTLQAVTKPAGQLITGSAVNTVLAMAALVGGLGCGLTVALLSPLLAFALKIAPNILVVPAIMLGNAVFVALLWAIADRSGKHLVRQAVAWLSAAAAKFALMYAIVAWLICGLLASRLMMSGVLKVPMLKALPATFGWPQLATALIGGALALLMAPMVRKALKK